MVLILNEIGNAEVFAAKGAVQTEEKHVTSGGKGTHSKYMYN